MSIPVDPHVASRRTLIRSPHQGQNRIGVIAEIIRPSACGCIVKVSTDRLVVGVQIDGMAVSIPDSMSLGQKVRAHVTLRRENVKDLAKIVIHE